MGLRASQRSASRLSLARRICLPDDLRGYPWTTIARDPIAYPVPPSVIAVATWYRNINLLSIAYAFRPRLRSRLTLSRLALLRNPWAFGGGVSHSSFVTRASILTSDISSTPRGAPSQIYRTLRYHSLTRVHNFGAWLSPDTFSPPCRSTSELLRFL